MGNQKTMRLGDYLADGCGQFARNAISGLIGAITYFYTDKVGVSALTAAVISSGGAFPANVAEGMLELANGHLLKGLRKLVGKQK